MNTIDYVADNPPFNPDLPVEWAEARGKYIHLSQKGYSYKSGPYGSDAEMVEAIRKLKPYPESEI